MATLKIPNNDKSKLYIINYYTGDTLNSLQSNKIMKIINLIK